MSSVHKSRGGFTLIELLVVVAIIAMLISILLPSLSRARAKAQEVACMSQLRQIGIANFMYAQDNSQNLPAPFTAFNNPNRVHSFGTYAGLGGPGLLVDDEHRGWGETNYLGTPDMLFCPTQKVYTDREEGHFADHYGNSGHEGWIGYISWWLKPESSTYGSFGANDTVTRRPNRMIYMDFGWWFWAEYPSLLWIPSHEGRVNVLYLDGHAGGVPLDTIDEAKAPSQPELVKVINGEG